MSCRVWESAKFNETIKVSVAPALGGSITLSKTSDFHFGDTITVSATYPEHPILWFSINKGMIINTNQVVCWGDSIVVNAHLKYDHAIICNGTHATLAADKAKASVGDTVTLSYAMDENYVLVTYAPTQLTETKVQKVLRNGQVFLIRNDEMYDLTGRKLRSYK